MDDISEKITQAIDGALTDDVLERARKDARDIAEYLEDQIVSSIKDNLSVMLSDFVHQKANSAVKAMLEGNDEMMCHYLSCKEGFYTGRSDYKGWGEQEIQRQHPVIHGNLFESTAIRLRRKIVDAHAELLKTQRILDLEDQVKSLVVQVNSLHAALDRREP